MGGLSPGTLVSLAAHGPWLLGFITEVGEDCVW